MADPLNVEVVAADHTVWSGEADMVIARTSDGGAVVVNWHPLDLATWLADVMANPLTLLTNPVPVADAGFGMCADGICTSTGIYFEQQTPVPMLEMYTKGITFQTGRVHAGPAIPHVLDVIAGGWDPAPVTNRVAAWDDAAAALAEERGKLVITR